MARSVGDGVRSIRRRTRDFISCLIISFLLAACAPETTLQAPTPAIATTDLQPPLAVPSPQYPWSDENSVMSGICFEAALDAADQVFVLRTADDHIRFYDLADSSQLCRRLVGRMAFDFSTGRILAGLWSAGIGCRARHEVVDFERDDTARIFTLHLRLVIEGGCNYELVRPFWIGLDGLAGYEVRITITDR